MPNLQKSHAFGMEMPGRSIGSDFAYNFNGKRTDKWNGDNGSYLDFGARIHDTRLGRFLSKDEHKENYPSFSPYCFVGNDPISLTDLDGNDWGVTITTNPQTGEKTLKFTLTAAVIITGKSSTSPETAAKLMSNYLHHFAKINSMYNNISIEFDVKIRGIKTTAEIKPDDHVIEFASNYNMYDNAKHEEAGDKLAIGKGGFYGKYVAYSTDALYQLSENQDTKTIGHELFHTLGLRHIFDGIDNARLGKFDEIYDYPLELAQLVQKQLKPYDNRYLDDGAGTNLMDYGNGLSLLNQYLTLRQFAIARENIRKNNVNVDNIPRTGIALRNIAKFKNSKQRYYINPKHRAKPKTRPSY